MEPGLEKKQRDRLAILAMAGPYRTSFEFLEVVGYIPDFERARPYHSWSTEYISVVDDAEDFISLQHILVMFMVDEDGQVQGPFVQKHWRQDWQYEKASILEYVGNDTWKWRQLSADQTQGKWAQSVYQVDDSPRYESLGRWHHYPNFSTWQSETTWRPLPRRESSVRDDYEVLEGTNRHTIVPSGWVHEEENYKVKLDDAGEMTDHQPYLAKELGVNRYERIIDFDFSAGDEYWQETDDYWQVVREIWTEVLAEANEVTIKSSVDGQPLFMALFQHAGNWTNSSIDTSQLKEELRALLAPFIVE